MILFLKAKHHLAFFNRPSRKQIEAGNHKMVHRKFQGLDITIENARGSIRSGKDAGGHEWSVSMQHDYGYIKGTLGVDGDHFDVLLGPQAGADTAYIITTKSPPKFKADDEQKALLGFPNEAAAREAFHAMYDDPRFLGRLQAMPMEEFKRKVRTTRKNPTIIKGMVLVRAS